MNDVVFLDSITDVNSAHAGMVAASGSHGGLYPAAIASQAGLRAAAFNDAGIGFQRAGVEGVLALAEQGMAAIAADCFSCLIGDADDLGTNGRVSVANDVAASVGVTVGMSITEALDRLRQAPIPTGRLAKVEEARNETRLKSGLVIQLLDSASLVTGDDAGSIVVTGSHGALIGGDPVRALKAHARIAVFNDAGGGKQNVGVTRLPALDARGVAAVTVAATSARIGDAASALATGEISNINNGARGLGARVGQQLKEWLATIRE